MSGSISSDLVDLSAFTDVHRIEVFENLVLLFYSRHTKFLVGPRAHALAPLLALEEPMPSALGTIRPGTWTGASAIEINRAGCLPDSALRKRPLERPMHHPAGTAFFCLDTAEFKHCVRLAEFCRLAFDARGRACLVFNDIAYIVTPVRGTETSFRGDVTARFPKSKSGCATGEISGFSTWSDADYAVPTLSAHVGVESIRVIDPHAAVSDTSWSWIGSPVDPKPKGGGRDMAI